MSEDANSNYYERRSLATIGRSPHVMRDSIYAERVHLTPTHATAGSNASQTLPCTGRKVQNGEANQREIYCTCPQGTATIYGRNPNGRGKTSFITFKPENEMSQNGDGILSIQQYH